MPLLNSRDISILITTYNRKKELVFTLNTLRDIINPQGIYICDDASTDGTFEYISSEYPEINIFQNTVNTGLIASRNQLMQAAPTEYVLSLDDDAHYLNPEKLEKAMSFMQENLNCAVLSFRLFWGLQKPASQKTSEKTYQVNNFLGGAHLMRKTAWDNFIISYPEWYYFYGEEDYAAMQLFRTGQNVFYFPDVLVHHRVSIKNRKKSSEETRLRTKWALQAAWSNYLIFYPKQKAYYKILYSIKEQLRVKLFKGEHTICGSIYLALKMLFLTRYYRSKIQSKFSSEMLIEYLKLPKAPIYWEPRRNES